MALKATFSPLANGSLLFLLLGQNVTQSLGPRTRAKAVSGGPWAWGSNKWTRDGAWGTWNLLGALGLRGCRGKGPAGARSQCTISAFPDSPIQTSLFSSEHCPVSASPGLLLLLLLPY